MFAAPGVRLVIHPAFGIAERHVPVLLEGGEGALRRIDRQEGEVRTAEPFHLCVEVGEVAALQKRVVREVDAGNDVLRAERDLLGLGEEVVDAAVEHQAADAADGNLLLGNDLGGVEHVEVELIGEVLVEQLQAQLPLRKIAGLDRIPEVAAVEIRVRAVDLDRLVPDHRLEAELRLPMKLDEGRFALRVDEPEGVHAKAFHEAERARDRAVGHDPHDHVHAFRRQRYEIPEIVVRGLRLRKAAIGLLLGRVNEVRKLDGVLDEEHRDVVADDVPVAFFGIELDREAAHIAGKSAEPLFPATVEKRTKAGVFSPARWKMSARVMSDKRFIGLKKAVSPETAGVDHALRNALVVEVENLFAKMEVFERGRSPCAHPESILVIGNRNALLRCKNGPFAACDLMSLATSAPMNRLICEMYGRGLVLLTLLFHGDCLSELWLLFGWDLRRAVALTGRGHSSSEPSPESLVPSSPSVPTPRVWRSIAAARCLERMQCL